MKKYVFPFIILALTSLTSCGSSGKKNDPNFIRVGITSGPERELAEAADRKSVV